MNNIDLLKQEINNYLNQLETTSLDSVLFNLLEKNFEELDTIKFSTLLSNRVLTPIQEKINSLEGSKMNLGSSRTHRKKRRVIETISDKFKITLERIFTKYDSNLKGNSLFEQYKAERLKKFPKYESDLLRGSLEEDTLASILYPTYFNKNKIEELSQSVIEKFQKLHLDPDKFEYLRSRLIPYNKKITNSIEELSQELDRTKKELNSTEKKLKKLNQKDEIVVLENLDEVSLGEHYTSEFADLSYQIDNLTSHRSILNDLLKSLTKSYPFLGNGNIDMTTSKTVFGNSNFEVVRQLVKSIKENKFVSLPTSESDLIEVFTLNDKVPSEKINLTGGTLNDFGFLISEMRPYFIDSIKEKSNYSLWWSERFTFNSKEKNKKDVSNMISSIVKGVRFTSVKVSINKIIENLEPIPQ